MGVPFAKSVILFISKNLLPPLCQTRRTKKHFFFHSITTRPKKLDSKRHLRLQEKVDMTSPTRNDPQTSPISAVTHTPPRLNDSISTLGSTAKQKKG